GGAGSAGVDANGNKTNGGSGLMTDITGISIEYAAGGNTANDNSRARENSGNGGSGGYNATDGYSGSTGVVIVRFARPDLDVTELGD
ncbi:MAG: hypothetical protein LBV52_00350, partial [Spirochaetaceae bacterium]|nr:hypothetical protein [Spirochaetaceae bacterium]